MAQNDRRCLKKLQTMYQDVDWKINKERKIFLLQFCKLISVWTGQLPNLRDIFRPKQIDWVLREYVNSCGSQCRQFPLIEFVVRTGYKDVPRVDKKIGKPSSRRTTAVHQAIRYYTIRDWNSAVRYLFEIYDRFDVNYTDEFDRTHLLAACLFDCADVVETFLELGEDPNYIWQQTNNSLLFLAVRLDHKRVAELLLRYGADPNCTDKYASTPLHCICWKKHDNDLAEMLFKICEEKNNLVQVDALDNWGSIPLHVVVGQYVRFAFCTDNGQFKKMFQLLLRKGADPNLVNPEGLTILHVITKTRHDTDLAEVLFKICDEKHQVVEVDARDKMGRTPLQCAVENVLPNTVDVLLNKGADLSSVTFPPDGYFKGETYNMHSYNGELRKASGILIIVGRFEKRGYELSRTDALRLMKSLIEHVVFEVSSNSGKCWYDDEEFATKAKKIMILPGLSLHDFVRLRPEKATKLLVNTDYLDIMSSYKFYELPGGSSEACFLHLYEVICRGFFRRWALDSLLELTRYRLPILCCEMINDQLINQELFRICLAAAGQSL